MISKKCFIPALLTLFLVAGCSTSPDKVGFSRAQWSKMDMAQRQKIMRGYRSVQFANFKKSVMGDDVGPQEGRGIHVKIAGGTVVMPPDYKPQAYRPVSFGMLDGQCSSVRVVPLDGGQMASMKTCYRDRVLYLDPSPYQRAKRMGSAKFRYTPLWIRGQNYADISTSGLLRFRGATVSIGVPVNPDIDF